MEDAGLPGRGHRGRQRLPTAELVRAVAQPGREERHVAGAQGVADDRLRQAVDLEDDEARAWPVIGITARAGEMAERVAIERLVLVEPDDADEDGVDARDEDRGDEGREEAGDLDMGHEPGGDEQRQAHEEDREDAGDHDVRLREGEEEDRPHRERDEARDDGHQERREQVSSPSPSRWMPGRSSATSMSATVSTNGDDDRPGDEVAPASGPVDERVVLVRPDARDAMAEGRQRLGLLGRDRGGLAHGHRVVTGWISWSPRTRDVRGPVHVDRERSRRRVDGPWT